jgi:NAD(P)H-hydrate epimerase
MNLSAEIRKKWRPRRPAEHKGDYGRIFILAGSRGFTGAAHLTASACVRAGAGLVTLGVPDAVYPILARRGAEVMVRPFPSTSAGTFAWRAAKAVLNFSKSQDVLAVGPGLSRNGETRRLVRRFAVETSQLLVIDADGLNAFAGRSSLLKKCAGRAVLTPHPGEFVRLFGGKLSDSPSLRKKRAAEAATRFGVVIVLKGHRTVVASPEGKVYVNTTGNPGMASGGTGDVLTGIIAALIGQRFTLWDAARFAVYVHGLAGDLAAKKRGQVSLIASDLIEFLPAAFKNILGW